MSRSRFAWYGLPVSRLARQVAADLVMVLWTVVWWLVARKAGSAAEQFGQADRVGLRTLQTVEQQLTQARDRISGTPVIGGDLSAVLQQLIDGVKQLISQLQARVADAHDVSSTVHLLVLVVPTLPVLLIWLVTRLGLLRALSADAAGTGSSQ